MQILSWNIQWGRGIDEQVDLARTAEVARSFEADILCLQEVAVNHPGLPGGAAMNQPEWLAGLFLGYESVYGIGSDLPDGFGGALRVVTTHLEYYSVLQRKAQPA